jgi:AhpD family alkylhydroperoxidase
MEARMNHPVMILPDAMQAMLALTKAARAVRSVPLTTMHLIDLRASQINGCSFCVDMHSRELKEAHVADEKIWGVGAWRESPHFNDAERAALALTEAVTRLSDRSDPVPDAVWEEATRHYDEKALSAILIQIAAINVWNRLNAATRQPAAMPEATARTA